MADIAFTDSSTLTFIGVAFTAFVVRGATGAAAGIVFNALFLAASVMGLTGSIGLLDALYWLSLADMTASIGMAGVGRRSLRPDAFTLRILTGLVPSTIAFTMLLTTVSLPYLKLMLAGGLIAAGASLLADRPPRAGGPQWLAIPAGAAAGMLAGLFGMGGPIIFLAMGADTKKPTLFRRRMTAITLVNTSMRAAVLLSRGAYTVERATWFLVTAPVIVIGLWVGYRVHQRITPRQFHLLIASLICIAGLAALLDLALVR